MDAMHDEMAPDQLLSSTRQLAISHSSPALSVPAGDHGLGYAFSSTQLDSTYPAVTDARPCLQAADGARDDDYYYHHHEQYLLEASSASCLALFRPPYQPTGAISEIPNEIMLHILGYLDVNDLLSTSRVGVPHTQVTVYSLLPLNSLASSSLMQNSHLCLLSPPLTDPVVAELC